MTRAERLVKAVREDVRRLDAEGSRPTRVWMNADDLKTVEIAFGGFHDAGDHLPRPRDVIVLVGHRLAPGAWDVDLTRTLELGDRYLASGRAS